MLTLALGTVALVLGLGRQPAAVFAWGSLALGSRMETAPLLLVAVLVPGLTSWRSAARGRAGLGLAGGLGVFALQAFTLSQKRSELPVEDLGPDPSVLWENLGNVSLGGAWLGAGSLALCLCVIALAPRSGSWGRLGLAWLGCLGIALLQPVFLVDVGARHFLAAHALLLPVIAVSAAAWLVAPLPGLGGLPRWIVGIFVGGLGLAVGLQAFGASRALTHRYMSGHDAVLPEWAAAADAGRTGTAAELLDDRCYVVVPGGRSAWRGSRDSIDVREIHRAALALGAGWCVQWMVSGDAEFSGDTRAERLDRAVHTLGLQPTGWLDPPPDGKSPWLVLEAP